MFNTGYNKNCNNSRNSCYSFKTNSPSCIKIGSVLNSLFCVENFLCNYQKACSVYNLFRFFK